MAPNCIDLTISDSDGYEDERNSGDKKSGPSQNNTRKGFTSTSNALGKSRTQPLRSFQSREYDFIDLTSDNDDITRSSKTLLSTSLRTALLGQHAYSASPGVSSGREIHRSAPNAASRNGPWDTTLSSDSVSRLAAQSGRLGTTRQEPGSAEVRSAPNLGEAEESSAQPPADPAAQAEQRVRWTPLDRDVSCSKVHWGKSLPV